jgi:hypothetical protein
MKNLVYLLIALVVILCYFLFKKEIHNIFVPVKNKIEQKLDNDVVITNTNNFKTISILVNADRFARVYVNDKFVWCPGENLVEGRRYVFNSMKGNEYTFHITVVFIDKSVEEKTLVLKAGDVAVVNMGSFKK